MVTITDISKACGVSRATVSKALNGAPDIAPKTAERIREQAKALGYLPNATARALKVGRSYNIGVLFSDTTGGGITHEYFSQILESVKAEAERLGYDITFISKDLGAMSMDYYEHAKYRSCDGVVIASADFQDPAIVRLATSEIPTVTLDYTFDSRTSILSDNVHGMETLVRFVYENGHRKIAFIHGEMTSVTQKRIASFKKTCAELKIPVPPEYIRPAVYHDPRSSGLATRALLALLTGASPEAHDLPAGSDGDGHRGGKTADRTDRASGHLAAAEHHGGRRAFAGQHRPQHRLKRASVLINEKRSRKGFKKQIKKE